MLSHDSHLILVAAVIVSMRFGRGTLGLAPANMLPLLYHNIVLFKILFPTFLAGGKLGGSLGLFKPPPPLRRRRKNGKSQAARRALEER